MYFLSALMYKINNLSFSVFYIARVVLVLICFMPAVVSALPVENESSSDTSGAITEIMMDTEENESNFVLFLGRFHPLLVHLPIGFLLFAFLLECAAFFRRFVHLQHAVTFALLLGALSAVAAGATGYMLSTAGGYGEDTLSYHKWLGILVTVLAILAFLLRVKFFTVPLLKRIYFVILFLMAGALMATGHYGGNLTHGSDYLFRYMPEALRSVIGYQEVEEEIALIQDLDSALVYDHVIQPILGLRCQNCHNDDRTEGELLMTSFDRLMKGGESGPAIIPHQTNESELYQRLLLPASDDLRMPPKGRRQLTREQVKLIGWWIEQGAPSSSKVTELAVTDEISQILFKLTEEAQGFLVRTEVSAADPVILANLTGEGIIVSPVAEGVNFLQVRFSNLRDSISRSDLEKLLPIADQVTWINLARTGVRDEDLISLPEFRNLTRLNLQLTGITDSTLASIAILKNLEYLNIYGTAISDDGLQHLENMEKLKSLYLWQTDVSRERIYRLKERLPKLNVDSGWSGEEVTALDQEEASASNITEQ